MIQHEPKRTVHYSPSVNGRVPEANRVVEVDLTKIDEAIAVYLENKNPASKAFRTRSKETQAVRQESNDVTTLR